MSADHWILSGKIVGVHGIKGAVKIKSFTENPKDITQWGELKASDGTFLTPHFLHMNKECVIATIDDITDRDQAALLKNVDLFLDRRKLEAPQADEFYIVDLIGLDVMVDGAAVGTVKTVDNFGAGDLLYVQLLDSSAPVEVPFRKEFVPVVDAAAGHIVLDQERFQALQDLHR